MTEEYYMPPSPSPMMYYDIPKKGILDRPNSEYVSDESNLKVIREYTKVLPFPKEPKRRMVWDSFKGFINEQANLTFYDKKDKMLYDIDWDLNRYYFLMDLRPKEFNGDMRLELSNCKQYCNIVFNRSCGMPTGKTNERTAQQSTILHNISSNTNPMQPVGGGNFMGRLMNSIRGR